MFLWQQNMHPSYHCLFPSFDYILETQLQSSAVLKVVLYMASHNLFLLVIQKQYLHIKKNAHYLLSVLLWKGYFIFPNPVLLTTDPYYCLRKSGCLCGDLCIIFLSSLIWFTHPSHPTVSLCAFFLPHSYPTFSLKVSF